MLLLRLLVVGTATAVSDIGQSLRFTGEETTSVQRDKLQLGKERHC